MNIGVLLRQPIEKMGTLEGTPWKRLATVALESGHCCHFFTLNDIDIENKLVFASKIRPANELCWQTRLNPIPTIIYNQLDCNSLPTPAAQACFAKFVHFLFREQPQIKIFNLHQLDKYQAYQTIAKYKSLCGYLPATQLYDQETLLKFIKKYKNIYIKPLNLSLGQGICQVMTTTEGYAVKFRLKGKLCLGQAKTLATLLSFLPKIMTGEQYLVQETIDLATVNGDLPFLFRVHLFKNQQGNWSVAAIIGRVGTGKHDYLISPRFGGYLQEHRELLAQAFNTKAAKIMEKIVSVNLAIAPVLEQESPYLLGELGTDTLVDKYQQVKILEINYKPNWSLFNDFPHIQTKLSQSFLSFCSYLHGMQ